MPYPVYFVNAFTDTYYHGNPAAVVLLDEYPSDASLQALAKDFGFSETAFVRRNRVDKYTIRWFTPETEVNLCGHATLASAKVLFHDVISHHKKVTFISRSGELIATRLGDKITLDFPIDDPRVIEPDNAILNALSKFKAESVLYAPLTRNLIVVYQDTDIVFSLKPDYDLLNKQKSEQVFGIIATALGHEDYDYVCRYFAPWEGINEDPVTGSAQTCLAPYWQRRLNKQTLKGYQASERTGSFVVEVQDNRVLISGTAFIYLKGELKRGF